MAVDPDHPCPADFSLGVDMLMAMDQDFGLLHADVLRKGVKASMNLVLFVVDASGRVVGNEDIHIRKVFQQVSCLILFIEEVAPRLVLPGAVEPAETDSLVLADRKVEVHDGVRKRAWEVMVAFYGKDHLASEGPCRLQNQPIADIATGYQDIGPARASSPFEVINIGYDKEPHGSMREKDGVKADRPLSSS